MPRHSLLDISIYNEKRLETIGVVEEARLLSSTDYSGASSSVFLHYHRRSLKLVHLKL